MKTLTTIKDVLKPKALIPLMAVVIGITLSIIGPSEATSLEDVDWPNEVDEAQGGYDHLITMMGEQAEVVAYWQSGERQAISVQNGIVQATCSQEVVLGGLKYYVLLEAFPEERPADVQAKIEDLELKLNKNCDYFQ